MSENEFLSQLVNLEPSLEKFAYGLTQKKTDAQDLVQDTFLKGLLHRDKFVNNENFKAWVFTIMKNTFINDYRRNFRMCIRNDQSEEAFYFNRIRSSGFDDPDSAYSIMEMYQVINQLNDKFRIPFKMHVHGYKYKEIADALNLKIGTVKSRIFLSRKQLMSQLRS